MQPSFLVARFSLLAALTVAGARAQEQPSSPDPAAQDPGAAAPARIPIDVDAEQRGLPVRELTIDDALQLGRRFNVGIRAAEVLPEQALLDVRFVEAGFLPELYGSTGYRERKSPQRNAFSPSITSKTIDAQLGWRQRVATGGLFDLAFAPTRFESDSGGGAFPSRQFQASWSASFRQPLLRGAWTDYNLGDITAARYRARQARHEFDRTVQDTLLEIVGAYWELVYARENWRVVHSALDVAQEQLRITLERIRLKELARRDRIADEAEVARRREELIVAENAIRDRQDDLRRLLFDGGDDGIWRRNLRPVSPFDVEPEPLPPYQELVEVAMQQRPTLRGLRSAVADAEVAALQAERDLLPQLDLIGSYTADGVSTDDTTTGARGHFHSAFRDASEQDYPDWSVRLEFAIPIGNQAARSQARRATLEVERRRRLLHAAVLDVTQEVREALRRLDTLAQSIRASAESVRLAVSNLETERVKQRVGVSTAFEVQRRNQELQEARSRLLRNQLDYRTAESRLLYVQGLLQVSAE